MVDSGAKLALDRFFKITERGSSVTREVRGGFVTFMTMAYIIVLNPLIIGSFSASDSGAKKDILGHILPVSQVAVVTALVAGVMTILMGLIANYPFAIATGLGINAIVSATLAPQMTWPEAMGLVVIEGLIISLLVLTGFRTAVFSAIPHELKAAIAVGIGLFLALIGFVDAGFVRRLPDAANTTVPVGFGLNGSISTWPTVIFVFGLLLTGILIAKKVKGGILLGILGSTVAAVIVEKVFKVGPSNGVNPKGWNLSTPNIPTHIFDTPNFSLVGNVSFGAWTRLPIIVVVMFVFTLVIADFFDAMGTMTGLANQAELIDEDGQLPNVGKALFVEGLAGAAGGLGSASSNTVFVESSSGIAEGARTGLANIVTGVLFLAAMFFTPLYQVVPIEAAAPALVIVGALMIRQIKAIDFNDFTIGLPAFLTIVTMPFTYSIATGIGVGFITHVLLKAFAGKAKSIHPLMWAVSAAFAIYFAAGPIESLLH